MHFVNAAIQDVDSTTGWNTVKFVLPRWRQRSKAIPMESS